MDLATRRIIRELEGDQADIGRYQDPDGAPYQAMIGRIRERLGLSSLAFQRLDDLKASISLPGDPVCTYCWTGQDVSLKSSCAGGCQSCARGCVAKSV